VRDSVAALSRTLDGIVKSFKDIAITSLGSPMVSKAYLTYKSEMSDKIFGSENFSINPTR
jgi:hypothetical protein